ncbi:MAG: hypothetical protein ACYC0X_04905 [Pirellulaceae bacterium]
MDRQSEWDEQWRQMAALLRHYRRMGGRTLAEAQQLYDAAPDVSLSPACVLSLLAQVQPWRTPEVASTACQLLGEGILCATAWMPPGPAFAEPSSLIGIHAGHAPHEAITQIGSDRVDVRRMSLTWPPSTWHGDTQGTDCVVFDVSSGCQEWDRSQYSIVRQGTVLWDACIDGKGLDACEVASRFDLWCDSRDHDREAAGWPLPH